MVDFIDSKKEDVDEMADFIDAEKEDVDEMVYLIIKEKNNASRWQISLPTKKKLSNMVILWKGKIQRKEFIGKHLGFHLQLSEMVMSMNFPI